VLGKIGTCGALHRSTEPCWVTNNAFAIRPGKARSHEFTWHTLRGIDFAQFIGGSANPYMPLKNFGHYQVSLPPAEMLDAFEAKAGTLRRRIEANARESRTLATLRDALLPKLLSGDLRVPAATSSALARTPASTAATA
jgi:type I restriction enzyme, S subunit